MRNEMLEAGTPEQEVDKDVLPLLHQTHEEIAETQEDLLPKVRKS